MASNGVNGSGSTSLSTMSVAGDRDTATSFDTESLLSVPASVAVPAPPHNTPANTIAGSTVPEEEYLERRTPDIDLARLSFESARTSGTANVDTSFETASTTETEGTEHHHEHSTWYHEAVEMMQNALARLAVLARDEHLNDPSKSVEEHYSERLAKLIKEGAIKFDAAKLG